MSLSNLSGEVKQGTSGSISRSSSPTLDCAYGSSSNHSKFSGWSPKQDMVLDDFGISFQWGFHDTTLYDLNTPLFQVQSKTHSGEPALYLNSKASAYKTDFPLISERSSSGAHSTLVKSLAQYNKYCDQGTSYGHS
jgi:hypothetical protein